MKGLAVIAGVGPGTGAALARRFGQGYTVALLARSQETLDEVVKDVKSNGGDAIGFSTDVTSESSVKKTFKSITSSYPDASLNVAIYNVGGGFVRKSVLDLDAETFDSCYRANVSGALFFSQAALPLLLKAKGKHELPPTLIYTGATASIRSGANFSAFACAKFGLRALSQSIAKEFGPQGIHVSHTIIDGIIDTPRTKAMIPGGASGSRMNPDAIAELYWQLHAQHPTVWTWELDSRPSVEKW